MVNPIKVMLTSQGILERLMGKLRSRQGLSRQDGKRAGNLVRSSATCVPDRGYVCASSAALRGSGDSRQEMLKGDSWAGVWRVMWWSSNATAVGLLGHRCWPGQFNLGWTVYGLLE